MAKIVNCPNCQRYVRIPDERAGEALKCLGCGYTFPVDSKELDPAPEMRSDAVSRRPLAPVAKGSRYDKDDFDDDWLDRSRYGRRFRRNLAPHRGQVILILGILSLVTAGFILGPIAWILANHDLKEIREGRMDPEGESNTSIGRICGIIGTILNAVGIAIVVLFYGCFFMAIAGSAVAPAPGPAPGTGS